MTRVTEAAPTVSISGLAQVLALAGFLATPATSLILANLVLHEPFTPDLLAGTGLVTAGVACGARLQKGLGAGARGLERRR